MCMGAICFTSSISSGGCWVVLVFSRNLLFFWKRFFFSTGDIHQRKKVYAICAKRKSSATYSKKNATFAYFRN